MSGKLMGEVFTRDVGGHAQQVLLALSDHYGENNGGHVYPSVDRIAWKTGLSARTVQRILSTLRARGALVVERKSGYKRPTHYRINLSAIPKKPEFVPKGDRLSPNSKGVSERAEEGDSPDEMGDKMPQMGDTAVSPESSFEPSLNRQETSDDVAVLWNRALPILKDELGKAQYRQFIEPLMLVGVDGDTVTLSAPTQRICECVQPRLRAVMERKLTSVARHPVKVVVELAVGS